MIGYILTDANGRARDGRQWGEGVTHDTDGSGELCGPGWLRYYTDPLLAVLLDPIRMALGTHDLQLWECEAGGQHKGDRALRVVCTRLTTVRRVPVPIVSTQQRIRFGVLCVLAVIGERCPTWLAAVEWVEWAAWEAEAAEAVEAMAKAAEWAAWASAACCLSLNLSEIARRAINDEGGAM